MYKEVIGENERIGKNGKAKCFCCGNYTIDRLFEECSVCLWQYDGVDFRQSEDKRSEPNAMSVKEARKIFEEDGVCVPGFKHLVRDPIDDELPENNE